MTEGEPPLSDWTRIEGEWFHKIDSAIAPTLVVASLSEYYHYEVYESNSNWECQLFVVDGQMTKSVMERNEEHFLSVLKPLYDGPIFFAARGEDFPEVPRNPRDIWIDELVDRREKARTELYTSGVLALEARLDAVLARVPYQSVYLRSAHWRRMRELAIEHYGNRCSACGSDRKIQVHHRIGPDYNAYHRRGAERLEDLSVFCDECHAKFHDKAA